MKPLSELAEIRIGMSVGVSDYTEEGIIVLRAGDISDICEIEIKDEKFIQDSEKVKKKVFIR